MLQQNSLLFHRKPTYIYIYKSFLCKVQLSTCNKFPKHFSSRVSYYWYVKILNVSLPLASLSLWRERFSHHFRPEAVVETVFLHFLTRGSDKKYFTAILTWWYGRNEFPAILDKGCILVTTFPHKGSFSSILTCWLF